MIRALSRLPLFWKLHLSGWLLLILSVLPIRVIITRSPDHPWGALETGLGFLIFRDVIGMVLCLGLRALYRLKYFERRHPLVLGLHLAVISVGLALLDVVVAEACFDVVDGTQENVKGPAMVAAAFWLHLFVFFLWSGLYFFLKAHLRARQRLRMLAETAARQREAELLMLRAHLEPHFIFNALNVIAILSHGNPAVAPVIRGCSEYLRFCLANRDKAFVPLGEELEAITQYLTVEQARFGSGLEVAIDVNHPNARHIPVPGIFVMPLVENAIKHRDRGNDPLQLRIEVVYCCPDQASMEDLYLHPNRDLSLKAGPSAGASEIRNPATGNDELTIRVISTTTWKDPADRALAPSTGVGLSTLRRRLELLYPGRSQFTIGPQGTQVVAEIRVQDPLHTYETV